MRFAIYVLAAAVFSFASCDRSQPPVSPERAVGVPAQDDDDAVDPELYVAEASPAEEPLAEPVEERFDDDFFTLIERDTYAAPLLNAPVPVPDTFGRIGRVTPPIPLVEAGDTAAREIGSDGSREICEPETPPAPDTASVLEPYTRRFPDGSVMENGHRRLAADGNYVKEGVWTYFSAPGVKQAEIEYKNDRRDGKSVTWYPSGQKETETFWADDVEHGPSFAWYENGRKRSLGAARHGRPDGVWKWFDAEGGLVCTSVLAEGSGTWHVFDDNGVRRASGEYVSGRRSGEWIFYDERGDEKYMTVFKNDERVGDFAIVGEKDTEGRAVYRGFVDADGEKAGEWTWFYPDGGVRKTGTYLNGRIHGVWRSFHPGGRVSIRGEARDGQMHGAWVWYSMDGKVLAESRFEDGTGRWFAFHENGVKKIDGKFVGGVKEGLWTSYYVNGAKSVEGRFKNGAKHGKWIDYTARGEAFRATWYKDGVVATDPDDFAD